MKRQNYVSIIHLDLHKVLGESFKHFLPNGGLMVIYHGVQSKRKTPTIQIQDVSIF